MRPELAIACDSLGKKYEIMAPRTASPSGVRWRLPFGAQRQRKDVVWALKDVSFEVPEGEVLGIIGRNGAGKSTLLKVLSQITDPTSGYADVRGRVNSLLEVGTGFHGELSGRENVYLNGALHGLRRVEVNRKFDEIVEFAGVQRFIDTPVKRYSSGMYVRLAFAVAAHLEPDVLIVDEVLAVGDAAFQQQCLSKMDHAARGGRTVIFVSHNMQSVKALCRRVLMLDGGRLTSEGEASAVIDEYLRKQQPAVGSLAWDDPSEMPGNAFCRLAGIRLQDASGSVRTSFLSNTEISVAIDVEIEETPHPALGVGFDLLAADGTCIFRSYHSDAPERVQPRLTRGRNTLICSIPAGLLNSGEYTVSPRLVLHSIDWILEEHAGLGLSVIFAHGSSELRSVQSRVGLIAPEPRWSAASVLAS